MVRTGIFDLFLLMGERIHSFTSKYDVYPVEEVLFYTKFVQSFYQKWSRILSIAFPAMTDMINWIFFFSLLM